MKKLIRWYCKIFKGREPYDWVYFNAPITPHTSTKILTNINNHPFRFCLNNYELQRMSGTLSNQTWRKCSKISMWTKAYGKISDILDERFDKVIIENRNKNIDKILK